MNNEKKRDGLLARFLKPGGWGTLCALLMFGLSLCLLSVVVQVRDAGTWSDRAYDLFRYAMIGLLGLSGIAAQYKIAAYIAAFPRRGLGLVLLILGCGFSYVGLSDHGRGPGPLFAIIGLCMLAVSTWLLYSSISQNIGKQKLNRTGERHEARIVQVQPQYVYVNGRQRTKVVCEWNGHQFQTGTYLSMHGAEGGTVALWVDPSDPSRYAIDLEEITWPVTPLPPEYASGGGSPEAPAAQEEPTSEE